MFKSTEQRQFINLTPKISELADGERVMLSASFFYSKIELWCHHKSEYCDPVKAKWYYSSLYLSKLDSAIFLSKEEIVVAAFNGGGNQQRQEISEGLYLGLFSPTENFCASNSMRHYHIYVDQISYKNKRIKIYHEVYRGLIAECVSQELFLQ